MPLFDLNNLEHTSCQHGSCSNASEPWSIVPINIQEILNNPISKKKEIITIVSKLRREDF